MQTINAQTIIAQLLQLATTATEDNICGPVNFVAVRTSERGSVRLRNLRSNIEAFADKVRKNAAAFGGGLVRAPKAARAVAWPAAAVKVVAEMLEDGNTADAAALAIQKCGAMFFSGPRGTFMTWAPQPVEGLPDCLVSVRSTTVNNQYQVIHTATGQKIGDPARSRKTAEQSALTAWAAATDAQRAMVPTMTATYDTAAARADYLASAGVTDASELQPETAPAPKQAKAPAAKAADAGGPAAALQTPMQDAGWVAEVASPDNVIWTKSEQGEEYAAFFNPERREMHVSVWVRAVKTDIASFAVADAKTAAQRANKTVTDDAQSYTTPAAEAIAAAQAAAAIEAATESAAVAAIATTQTEEQAEEVAEVCATAENSSHQAGRAMIGRVAAFAVERGQVIASKSGNWSAVFYNCPTSGRPSLRFMYSEADGRGQDSGTYENGRERMADLQRKAKAADYAAAQRAEYDAIYGDDKQAPAMTPQFERAKAQAFSLSQTLAQGIDPQNLIGLGINYTGDAANPGGEGAIIEIDASSTIARVKVQLEDGREWSTLAHSFNPAPGCRFALNWKMHGQPYLAQLAAAVASRKASKTAKAETQEQAFNDATEQLAAEYPYLNKVSRGGGKEAAQNVRILLKREFKGVKFSVTSDYSSLNIKWTDGPTVAQVNHVVGRFDIGRSDTQSDYFYTEESPWSKLFGGVQYLWTSRTESPELVAAVLAEFLQGRALQATADDYIKCRGVFDWRTGDEYARRKFAEMLHATPATPKAKA
jgi:hypothetical protein